MRLKTRGKVFLAFYWRRWKLRYYWMPGIGNTKHPNTRHPLPLDLYPYFYSICSIYPELLTFITLPEYSQRNWSSDPIGNAHQQLPIVISFHCHNFYILHLTPSIIYYFWKWFSIFNIFFHSSMIMKSKYLSYLIILL